MPPRKRAKVAVPRTTGTTQATEQLNERINPLTVDLAVTLGTEHALRLERPIVVASGPLGFGNEAGSAIDLRDVGLFVVRGFSLRPRYGGQMPRLVEVPGGLMHAVSRENPGADEVMDRHGASWRSAPCAVALSLVATSVKELAQLIARVERRADELGIVALEVDLTAPCDGLDGSRWEVSTDEARRSRPRRTNSADWRASHSTRGLMCSPLADHRMDSSLIARDVAQPWRQGLASFRGRWCGLLHSLRSLWHSAVLVRRSSAGEGLAHQPTPSTLLPLAQAR